MFIYENENYLSAECSTPYGALNGGLSGPTIMSLATLIYLQESRIENNIISRSTLPTILPSPGI